MVHLLWLDFNAITYIKSKYYISMPNTTVDASQQFFEVLFNNSASNKHRPDIIYLNTQKLISGLSCASAVAWIRDMQIRRKDRKLNVQGYWNRNTLCLFVPIIFPSPQHALSPVHSNPPFINPENHHFVLRLWCNHSASLFLSLSFPLSRSLFLPCISLSLCSQCFLSCQ